MKPLENVMQKFIAVATINNITFEVIFCDKFYSINAYLMCFFARECAHL